MDQHISFHKGTGSAPRDGNTTTSSSSSSQEEFLKPTSDEEREGSNQANVMHREIVTLDPQAHIKANSGGEATLPSLTTNGAGGRTQSTTTNASCTVATPTMNVDEMNSGNHAAADQGGRIGRDETEEQKEFKQNLAGNRGTIQRLDALYNDFISPRIQGSDSDGYKFRPKQFLDWLEQWPHNKDENIKVIKKIRAIDFEKEISLPDEKFLFGVGGVMRYLVATLRRHEKIERALDTLCDFSQKTETSASTTQNSGTKRKLNDDLTEKSLSSLKNRDAEDAKGVVRIQGNVAHLGYWVTRIENYPFQEIGRLELSMIDGLEVWKTNDFDVSNINGLSKDGQAALKEFNTLLQTVFEKGPVISSDFRKDDTKKEFLKSLEKLENFLTNTDRTATSIGSVQIPAIQAPEVDFVQPFIHVVMRSLGRIVDRLRASNHDEASKDSPAKTNIQTNRYLPKDDKRTARLVDKSIGANSRHVYLYRDDT
eukprot:scaffold12102_cov101-Cylindrotheca_fusiformis.AAC.1